MALRSTASAPVSLLLPGRESASKRPTATQ
jgi:hypothetical protein